jgi:hypothetical protein
MPQGGYTPHRVAKRRPFLFFLKNFSPLQSVAAMAVVDESVIHNSEFRVKFSWPIFLRQT